MERKSTDIDLSHVEGLSPRRSELPETEYKISSANLLPESSESSEEEIELQQEAQPEVSINVQGKSDF